MVSDMGANLYEEIVKLDAATRLLLTPEKCCART